MVKQVYKHILLPVLFFVGFALPKAHAITATDIVPDTLTICYGDTITLTVDTTLISPAKWVWSTGDTTASVTIHPLVSGYYIITVTDTSGSYADSTFVLVSGSGGLVLTLPDSMMNQCDLNNVFKKKIYSKYKVTYDIMYGSNINWLKDRDTLLLDFYEPDDPNNPVDYLRPLIIFAHGGGFSSGDKLEIQAFADSFARRGYAVASINYRLGFQNGNYQAEFEKAMYRAVQDMNTSIRYFRENALQYMIDTSQIFIGGSSAGSIAAIYSTYMDKNEYPLSIDTVKMGGVNNTGGHKGYSCRSKGVLNCWGGVLDTNLFANNTYPPLNSFSTTDDPVIPYKSGLYTVLSIPMSGCYIIYQNAKDAGIETYLSSYGVTRHGIKPGQAGWDSLIRSCSRFLYNQLTDKFATKACFKINAFVDSSATYKWAPASGLNKVAGTSVVATPVASQTYTVTAKTAQGCTLVKTFSLTVNPKVKVVISPANDSICYGQSTVLGAFGGETYTWTPADGLNTTTGDTVTANPTKTTTYTVMGFDANGCTGTKTVVVTVNPLPVLSMQGLTPSYCHTSVDVLLNAIPSGGLFSGDGVTDTVFSPGSIALMGIPFPINYEYTDSLGCSSDTFFNVNVHANPVVSFTGLDSNYCQRTSPVVLTGTPFGGTFTGLGITGNNFSPPLVSSFFIPIPITYSYIDSNACSDDTTESVIIFPNPAVDFIGLASHYCITSPDITLLPTPGGGLFNGEGISDTIFSPSSVSTIGSAIQISYTYTDSNNCTADTSHSTIVYPLPVLSIAGLAEHYCTTSPVAQLTPNPAGGLFTGDGVTGSSFSPSSTAIIDSSIIISYAYTDVHGCSADTSDTTIVYSLPEPTLTGLGGQYCESSNAVILTGSPAGGIYSGKGLNDSLFTPALTNYNKNTVLYYTYTDTNGCKNIDSASTIVYANPDVNFSGLASTYCQFSPAAALIGLPTGGSFKGEGLSTGTFTPKDVITFNSPISIVYTYTDSNSCTDSAIVNTLVYKNPSLIVTAAKTSLCKGEVLSLSSIGLTNVNWVSADSALQSSGKATSYIPLQSTTVYAYGNDGHKCSAADSVAIVVHELPILSITPMDTFICPGNDILMTVTGADAYRWFPQEALGNSTGAEVVANPTRNISYKIIGTNSFGCKDTVKTSIRVNTNTEAELLEIYPNPTSGMFTIQFKTSCIPDGLEISILNMFGQEVRRIAAAFDEETQVDMRDCSSGVYIVMLKSPSRQIFGRVIIQ